MKKPVFIILQSAFILFISASCCFAEDGASLVGKANRLYKQAKYDEAIKLYNEAQIKSPGSAEISYDLGVSQYKKEDYASAIGSFEKATISKDRLLEAKANFNIANAKYKMGKLKENTDLEGTVGLLRQSLDYYKRSIELDPKDEDAKINHELVERELKALLDKLKQRQEQEKKQEQSEQEKQKQEDQAQARKAGQENDQEKKEGQEGNGNTQGQEGEKQEERNGRQKDEKEGQQQEGGEQQEAKASRGEKQSGQEGKQQCQPAGSEEGSAEEPREMSEQEANMLLDSCRQDEGSMGKLEDSKRRYSGKVLKDW